jgi:hypothetical protein
MNEAPQQGGLLNALLQRAQQRTGTNFQLPGLGRNKNKKAPQTPAAPQASQVPSVSGGMFQRSDPAQRNALLQAMMARSRGGGPAPAGPVTPPAGVV